MLWLTILFFSCPGVPVYLTAGIIVVKKAWDGGAGPMGFWPAVAFASLIGILCKLPFAFAIQWYFKRD